MKKIWLGIIGVLVIVVAIGLAKPELFQGKIGLAKASACTNQWQKIFEGSTDADALVNDVIREYQMEVVKPFSYQKMDFLIKNGCDFKVVVESAAGGGAMTKSFECNRAVLATEGSFICHGVRTFNGIDGAFDDVSVRFDENNQAFFILMENQADLRGGENISLFAKQ